MELTYEMTELLKKLFLEYNHSHEGVNAARFRVNNERYIQELNSLEQKGYIGRRSQAYIITPLLLGVLQDVDPEVNKLIERCNLVFAFVQGSYRDNLAEPIYVKQIIRGTGLKVSDVLAALQIIIQTPILGSHNLHSGAAAEDIFIAPSEQVLNYTKFDEILSGELSHRRQFDVAENQPTNPRGLEETQETTIVQSENDWIGIQKDYGITKVAFGKKIHFVKDKYKRFIIFRDVQQAYVMAKSGYSKPVVILAGGVIEELLRLYLEFKNIEYSNNTFNGYIQTCEEHRLLKGSVSRLSDSLRQFRNLVHMSAEATKKHTLSKSTAIGAVSSIFTVIDDF